MTTEIEWRRQWKPDLRSCPWQPIKIDNENYLIKTRFTQDSYEILVTDLTNFWYEELDEKPLKKRVQKLNPSVEASVSRILDQIRNCLESPDSLDTNISIGFKAENDVEDKMMLKLNSQLAGMPFTWHFIGKPAEKEMLALAKSSNFTTFDYTSDGNGWRTNETRQGEIVKVVETKDREIEDYKSQGVRTSRKHLETTVFVETAFENRMLTDKGFEEQVKNLGSTAFQEPGQDLYRQIMTKHAWIHRQLSKDAENNDDIDDGSLEENPRKTSSEPSWGTSRLPPSIAGSKSVSPDKSPKKSPAKSPRSSASNTPDASPVKDSELLRRQALERRLEQEDLKKQEKAKKKKKIAF